MLPLLGQVGEEAGGAREDRDGLDRVRREAEVEHDRGDGHRDVQRQRLLPRSGDGVTQAPREQDVGPADSALVRELEDPLGPRVDRPVHRMPEPRHPAAGRVRGAGDSVRDRRRLLAGRHLLLRLHEEPRARLGGAEDDRAAAEDPGGDGARGGSPGRRRASCGPRRCSASSRAPRC